MNYSQSFAQKTILSAVALATLIGIWKYHAQNEEKKRGGYITRDIVNQIYDSSVRVTTIVTLEEKVEDSQARGWFGSGVLLRDSQTGDNYVLTAEHVTPDEYFVPEEEREKPSSKQRRIKVLESTMMVEELIVAVVKEDEKADLALLKVEGSMKIPPYQGKIARELHPHNYVIGVGFPDGDKMYFITQVNQKEEKLTLLDITIKGGNSGGGVFLLREGKAELAGVVKDIHGMTGLENLREFFGGTVLEDEYLK